MSRAGAGLTDVAPDGSPVAVYARLPTLGEPEVVHTALPPGSAILELGAGAGRLTHALLELGHAVVAVDQSPEMLAHVRGAETILGDIETLSLGRRFPAVLLAGNLVNVPDDGLRRALLASCARHLLPTGRVLLQRIPPDWTPSGDWSDHGPVRMRLAAATRAGALVAGEMEYVVDGAVYRHAFRSRILADDELDSELAAVGLRLSRVLDERGAWVEAVPESDHSAT